MHQSEQDMFCVFSGSRHHTTRHESMPPDMGENLKQRPELRIPRAIAGRQTRLGWVHLTGLSCLWILFSDDLIFFYAIEIFIVCYQWGIVDLLLTGFELSFSLEITFSCGEFKILFRELLHYAFNTSSDLLSYIINFSKHVYELQMGPNRICCHSVNKDIGCKLWSFGTLVWFLPLVPFNFNPSMDK